MNNVIQFPTAATPAAATARSRANEAAEELVRRSAIIEAAVEAGLLPAERKIPDALAIKLIKHDGLPAGAEPDYAQFTGKYKTGDYKMGRLNDRPRQITLNFTTFTWYGDVVAEVKVWKTKEDAQTFADYENGVTERFYPAENTDSKIALDVVLLKHTHVADPNWKTEVI